jgi:hypothetical protein
MKKRILSLLFITVIFAVTLLSRVAAQTGQYQVTIKYYAISVSGISFNTAAPGKEYLILTLQITNNNYTEGFYVNPTDFYVIVNNVQYDYDAATFSLQNPLSVATVLPGGTLTGEVAFLVPGTYGITPSFQPTYQFVDTPTINWVEWSGT